MRLSDSFKLSVNSILHRRLRSWLTLLGIIIGVGAVVAIISIGEGAQASITSQLSSFGAGIITISPGEGGAQRFGGAFRMGGGGGFGGGMEHDTRTGTQASAKEPTLTKIDVAIVSANPNVLYVNEIVSGRSKLTFLSEQTNASLQGVNPNAWKQTSNPGLAEGRFLTSSDSSAIVIGNRIANDIFKQPVTVGRKVTLEDPDGNPQAFTVVGILKESGSAGIGASNSDSTVFMPYTSAWNMTDVNKDTFSSLQARVLDAETVDQTTEELTAALQISRRVTAENQDFSITSAQAIKEQVSSITQSLTLFLGAIAAIALLVGAIGVANSMFTSVLEKTKLIGILKALGSTDNEIVMLFIIESGLFGLLGGIMGVVLGAFASIGIASMGGLSLPIARGGTTSLITPQLVIIAVVLSTVIGIVAGAMPARSAAKLKPVDALRYE
ncbi:MAG: ABC transporter permease [Candidatus Diapherotrites archaeon]|nr:ABC transporter permease [Candidatus Diapherotrites archaeon]